MALMKLSLVAVLYLTLSLPFASAQSTPPVQIQNILYHRALSSAVVVIYNCSGQHEELFKKILTKLGATQINIRCQGPVWTSIPGQSINLPNINQTLPLGYKFQMPEQQKEQVVTFTERDFNIQTIGDCFLAQSIFQEVGPYFSQIKEVRRVRRNGKVRIRRTPLVRVSNFCDAYSSPSFTAELSLKTI